MNQLYKLKHTENIVYCVETLTAVEVFVCLRTRISIEFSAFFRSLQNTESECLYHYSPVIFYGLFANLGGAEWHCESQVSFP